MWAFRDAPIKQKLTLVIALTSTSALVLVSVAAVGYDIARFRHDAVLDLTAQAQIISEVSAPALAAGDRELVGKVISALATQAEIVYGRVFGADGRLLAEYARRDAVPQQEPLPPQALGTRFQRGLVFFSYPVALDNQKVGTLMLCADLRELRAHFKGGASILAVVALASLLVALILA